MSLSEVSNILWRERQLLELLVFKLEEEQLVLASGRTRWLSHATREVETILGEIKRVELERAMAVAGAIGELGLSDAVAARARRDRAVAVGRHLRRAPARCSRSRRRSKRSRSRTATCSSAASRPRARRSRRSARSTSTRTTPAAACPIARSHCDWSTRRFDEVG